MTVNVGVIGTGMIGQDHLRRIGSALSGVRTAGVTDVDLDRAKAIAGGAPVFDDGHELIGADEVDAVLVCSSGPTHEEYVLACIAAGKQVFCEKPLATSREACDRIIDAEVAAGRRMVMVGFMRRYDDGYRDMRAVVAGGDIGAPLIFHSAHRNPAVPDAVTSAGMVVDTCVHDIDTARFLLGAEVAAIQVATPRRSGRAADHLQDPMVLLAEMSDGTLTTIEASVNIGYGYDIRGEIVGETGTVELAESNRVVVKRDGRFDGRVPADWRERFARAYDAELQAWVDAVAEGHCTGPSAWDGYAATVVCDAGVEALENGRRAEVRLRERPELYA